jgi:hypothetical protein
MQRGCESEGHEEHAEDDEGTFKDASSAGRSHLATRRHEAGSSVELGTSIVAVHGAGPSGMVTLAADTEVDVSCRSPQNTVRVTATSADTATETKSTGPSWRRASVDP